MNEYTKDKEANAGKAAKFMRQGVFELANGDKKEERRGRWLTMKKKGQNEGIHERIGGREKKKRSRKQVSGVDSRVEQVKR